MRPSKVLAQTLSQQVETTNEKPKDYSCAAHGCPLPGSISNSIGPNGTFYCRFHYGADIREWSSITHRIRNGELLANERQGKDDYLSYITDKFKKEGMKEFRGNFASYAGVSK